MKGISNQSELTFQLIVEAAPSAMLLVNNDGKIAYLNSKTESLFGYARNELIGKSIETIISQSFVSTHPNSIRDMFYSASQASMMGGVREIVALNKNGVAFPVEIGLNPLVTINGVWVVADIIDITERKKFQEQNTLFASITNSSDDAIFSKSLDGIITSWNHGAEKVFGYLSEEIIGKHIFVLIPENLRDEEDITIKILSTGESVNHFETHRVRKDGKVIHVSLTISPIKDSYGNIVGASIICRDNTKEKEAEEKLINANRLYAFLSKINQSIVHIKERQALFDRACEIAIESGKFNFAWIGLADEKEGKVNLVAYKGIDPKKFLIYDNLYYKKPEFYLSPLERAITTGYYGISNDIENDAGMKNFKNHAMNREYSSVIILPLKQFGKPIGAFCCSSPDINFFDDKEIALLVEAAGDISYALDNFEKEQERKAFEEQIEESELSMKEAQAIANLGSWELDLATGNTVWSEENCRIFGVAPEENHQNLDSFFSFIHPDDLDFVRNEIEECMVNSSDSAFHSRIIRRDGTIRHVYTKGRFRFDEDGKPFGVYGISHDVTERKNAEEEKEKLVNELIENNKELLQFSYITSHNLRAPLTNLVSISRRINPHYIEDELTRKLVEGFKQSTMLLNDTLNDLINILIIKENRHIVLTGNVFEDIFNKVKNSISTLLLKNVVKIETDFSEAPSIYFSDVYLESIFLNLLTNSIKYAHPTRYPLIAIKTYKDVDGSTKLTFTDNGIGMNMERVKNKIFGLYQRFHSNSDGKGIGLYLIHSQITTLGGKIEVESEESVGTTFTITFK